MEMRRGSAKALAVLLTCTAAASAACVNGHPTVPQEYNSSKVVFIGIVISTEKTSEAADGYFFNGDTYAVKPTRMYKGKVEGTVELFSENSSGRFPMELKREYLVFAYADHGRLAINNCGNSNLLSRATKATTEVARLSHQR